MKIPGGFAIVLIIGYEIAIGFKDEIFDCFKDETESKSKGLLRDGWIPVKGEFSWYDLAGEEVDVGVEDSTVIVDFGSLHAV